MAAVNKMSSNSTSLAYAAESTLGVLPGSPSWKYLEPNSYSDFGGESTKVSPTPINDGRQRKSGELTDLDVNAGFNHDLRFHNLTDMFESVMFASFRLKGTEDVVEVTTGADPDVYEVASTTGFLVGSIIKGFNHSLSFNNRMNVVTVVTSDTSVAVADGRLAEETPSNAYIKVVGHQGVSGDISVDASGDLPVIVSATLDFEAQGIVPGQAIYVGGDTAVTQFATAANNGMMRVRSVDGGEITIDKSVSVMQTDAGTSKTIQIYYGDVLKNETGSNITRKSFHIERTLGAPDNSSPGDIQSEYIKGAVASEFTLSIPSASLVNTDFNFLAIDHVIRSSSDGPIQSSVASPLASDIFNTSTDFSRIKMAAVSSTDEAPSSLYAFITEATITINNNLSGDKAVATLGSFDITEGTFTVSGSITAYFADVAAISAVRNNTDMTLDFWMVKNNQGIVLDLPLISLGDGRANVELNQAIKLPLSLEAATGEEISVGLNHTAMLTFFNYLPDAAE